MSFSTANTPLTFSAHPCTTSLLCRRGHPTPTAIANSSVSVLQARARTAARARARTAARARARASSYCTVVVIIKSCESWSLSCKATLEQGGLRVPLFLPPICILRDIPARREGSVFVDAHCSMLAQCWSLAYSATHSTLHPGRRHLPSRAVVQEDAPVLARATVQETPVTTASSLSTARKVTDRSQLRIAPSHSINSTRKVARAELASATSPSRATIPPAGGAARAGDVPERGRPPVRHADGGLELCCARSGGLRTRALRRRSDRGQHLLRRPHLALTRTIALTLTLTSTRTRPTRSSSTTPASRFHAESTGTTGRTPHPLCALCALCTAL